MRVSVLGAGDESKILRYTELTEKETKELIRKIGKILAKKNAELIILPSRGVPYSVAKYYKKYGGKKIIGLIPSKDKRYGIKHIEEYIGIEDEKEELSSWYELNGEIASKGDYCIVIGFSPGVMTEICMLKYHYKYLGNDTKLIIFRNTISQQLPKEVEEDLKNLTYVYSVEELIELLK